MEWINLKDEYPDISQYEHVIGADIWCEELRMHICEVGEKKLPHLLVQSSICPPIGLNDDAFWAPIPLDSSKEWIPFQAEEYFKDKDNEWPNFDEVIIKLKNGNTYVGSIQGNTWCPSFNQFRYGHIDNVTHYMDLPSYPTELNNLTKD